MSSIASNRSFDASGLPAQRAGAGSLRSLALTLVWLAIASSAVVFSEPAPVDILLMALAGLLPLLGMARFPRQLLCYAIGWLIIAIGGLLAATLSPDVSRSATHVFITLYLSGASVVLAGFIFLDPVRHTRVILHAYLCASLLAAALGIIGYFSIAPGLDDILTNFGRARGTFKDPNVFGAFLVPAVVYAFHNWATRRSLISPVALGILCILSLGVLLSFSRGAWAAMVVGVAVYSLLAFLTSDTNRLRLKLVLIGTVALIAIGIALVLAMQSEAIGALLSERASLSQSYDVGPEGRFGGQLKALELLLNHPLGIGSLVFAGNYHHEEVHNIYIGMFLNAGWLGGFAYFALVMSTIVFGFRASLRQTPWQGVLLVSFAAFFATAAEGVLIDSDHWRHFFILMALVWGLSTATSLYKSEGPDGTAAPDGGRRGFGTGNAPHNGPGQGSGSDRGNGHATKPRQDTAAAFSAEPHSPAGDVVRIVRHDEARPRRAPARTFGTTDTPNFGPSRDMPAAQLVAQPAVPPQLLRRIERATRIAERQSNRTFATAPSAATRDLRCIRRRQRIDFARTLERVWEANREMDTRIGRNANFAAVKIVGGGTAASGKNGTCERGRVRNNSSAVTAIAQDLGIPRGRSHNAREIRVGSNAGHNGHNGVRRHCNRGA